MYYLFIIVIFYIYMYSIYNYVNEVYLQLIDVCQMMLGCFQGVLFDFIKVQVVICNIMIIMFIIKNFVILILQFLFIEKNRYINF